MMQSILLSGGGGGLTLIGAISGAGLSSGLAVCLDAGDFQSFIGSGQLVLDRAGNNRAFFFGSGSAADASDPVFNGPAGYLPAYMSFQGTQFFEYADVSGSGVGWSDNYMQNGASFSVLAVAYITGTQGTIVGSANPTNGIQFGFSGQRQYLFVAGTAGQATVLASKQADVTMSSGRWHVMGVSVSEAIGSGFLYLNGAYDQVGAADTFDSTYTNPSPVNSRPLRIGNGYGLASYLALGARFSCAAIWSRSLTKANFDSIRNLIRARFGL